MTYAAVVDWYGPYAGVAEARRAIRQSGFSEVLYLAVGSIRRQTLRRMQYVGITRGFLERLNTAHTIRRYVKEAGLSLYIGEVSSHGVAGRRAWHQAKRHSVPVYLAESAIAFFLELPLNVSKRCSPPSDSITLINRWWATDLETRKRRRPHRDWPDLIEFEWDTCTGVVAWHGSRCRRINSVSVENIRKRASAELVERRRKAYRRLIEVGRRKPKS